MTEYERRMFVKQYQWRNDYHRPVRNRCRKCILIGLSLLITGFVVSFYLESIGR